MYATAARGTEAVVAEELSRLGFQRIKRGHGGVAFQGERFEDAMRACLHLRAAQRVLWPLDTFPAADADALYAGVAAMPWEDWLTTTSTLAVTANTRAAPPLAHAPLLAQRVKDGVVDRLRDKLGARPDVSRDDPDVRLYVHVEAAARSRGGIPAVTVGLDPSGDGLHARGYRAVTTDAPLRESLAAAVLLLSSWDGRRPLIDPMCGSGTLAIEAALLACRIAPGRAVPGRRFGFERWPRFGDTERATWRRLCAEADAAALPRAPAAIVAGDREASALAAARQNVARCVPAVAASLSWREGDARELAPLDPPGVIVTNPPYGERLGRGGGLEGFWRAFGQRLRTLDGHTAFVLVPDGPAEKWIGMRPSWSHKLMNGPLAVTLCRFELGRRGRAP